MVMAEVRVISGTTQVYHSSEAKGFEESDRYPIAWELIFINDAAGKQLTANVEKAFASLPREKGYIMDFQGGENDVARSVECVFRDKDAFRKILNESLPDMAIYDEQEGKVIPKLEMVERAKALTQEAALAV